MRINRLLTLAVIVFSTITVKTLSQTSETFTDTRDNSNYKSVKIGNQIWMAENLNYIIGDSWCYDNINANCNRYGRLYDWNTAKEACPDGWRLPSLSDFETLMKNVGGTGNNAPSKAYHALKEGGSSGFNALLGGYRHSFGLCEYIEISGHWWSSTESHHNTARNFSLGSWSQYANVGSENQRQGFSVRCIKE